MKNFSKNFFAVVATLCVMVVLTPQASGANLILNPGLEAGTLTSAPTVDAPDQWFRGGFGDNDRSLSYPSAGLSESRAATITITTYTDGDAKWYFADVPVTPGFSYNFTSKYTSDVPTELTAQFTDASHSLLPSNSYQGYLVVPASPSLATTAATFTAPAGASFMTVFHILKSVGTLTVDDYNLEVVPGGAGAFDAGFVSLTFDDGFSSHQSSEQYGVQTILASHGYKGTFYLITNVSAGFTTNPGAYFAVDGTHPADGWYYAPQNVIADKPYRFTDSYKGPANTLVAYVTLANNTVVKAGLDGGADTYAAATDDFATTDAIFYIPENAKSVQIVHETDTTDSFEAKDFNFGAVGYLTRDQAIAMQAAGHEIGGHSETHPDLTMVDPGVAELEIERGRQDLVTHGITPGHSFAYPEGQHNAVVESILNDAGYESGRTVTEGISTKNTAKNGLLTQSVNADTTVPQIQAWITEARVDRHWLILVFHNIDTSVSVESEPFGALPGVLQATVDIINTQNVKVCTVDQGVRLMTSGSISDCGATQTTDTAPVIALNGLSVMDLHVGDVFTDPGAIATDDHDASVTVTVGGDVVNTAAVGTYVITYNAVDSTGHHATQVTRAVNVTAALDTTAPVITLNGASTLNLFVGDVYTDPGATATDNVDGDVTSYIVVGGDTVNTAVVGTYNVTYNVSDIAGNPALQVTRTVNVSVVPDTTAPVITLNGASTLNLFVGDVYTDPGATATDNIDGNLTAQIVAASTVNTSVVGTYNVTYNVSDAAGNAAVQVTRTVNVSVIPDTTAPVITLLGDSTITIPTNSSFIDPGATAADDHDGDLTSQITTVSTVDTAIAGTYTVTYNVSDVAGNPATQVVRTVIVATPPSGGGSGGGGGGSGSGGTVRGASISAHPNGTLILDGTTIYLIKNGQRFGFRDANEYKSHGYRFNQAVAINSADQSLPTSASNIIKALPGTLVIDAADGRTVYMIGENNSKRGFASASVFAQLGYRFGNLLTINLSDYTSGTPITDSTNSHPEGALVLDGQTVWWILDGKRHGFESEAVFNTYGFSFDRIVSANSADLALTESSLVKFRDGTLVNKTGNYYIISDGKSRAFISAAIFNSYGYLQGNAITADLVNYSAGVVIK